MKSITFAVVVCLAFVASPAWGGVDISFPWDYTTPTFTPPTFDPPALPTLDDVKAKIEEVKQKVEEKYASLPTCDDWPTLPTIDDWPTLPTIGDWPTCPSLDDWPTCPTIDDVKAKIEEIQAKVAEKYSSLPTFDDWPTYPTYEEWQAKVAELKAAAEEKYSSVSSCYDSTGSSYLDDVQAKLDEIKQKLEDKFASLSDCDASTSTVSEELQAKIDAWKAKVEAQKEEIAAKQEELVEKYEEWAQTVVESVTGSTATEFCDGLYDLTDGDYLGSSAYLMTGGTLMGTGLVDSLFEQWGGVFSPGHSPGLVEFADDYVLAGGTLQLEIASDGGVPGVDLDFFDIAGDALLDSTVAVVLLDDFTPEDQDVFDVMTAETITLGDDFLLDQTGLGDWAGLFDLSIIDGGRGQILRLTAIEGLLAYGTFSANPEPSTLVMLASAGLCLLGFRWRRRRAARG